MNPSYEDFVDQTFSKRYRQLELDIMRDIVRRIKKTSEITSSADWQIMRLTIMGNSSEEIRNMIKEAGELSENDMQKLFDDVVEKEYTRSADLYKEVGANFVPYAQNTEMQQLTQALITQSNNELKSITGTMGFMLDYGDGQGLRFTPHTEIFDDYLNSAVMGIASGAFDYNTMIRRVVTQMTNSGLRTVDYASGRHDRVDVAARRAVLTGLSQLTGRITDTNAAALNTDHFEVAWHAGARPTHQEWQGRVWSKKELVDVCGLGSVTGLLGANCYHDYYPFIPGVSERMYSDEWLDQMNREENTPKIFRGKEYTAYEARQHQRYIERCMRAQREKVELLKEGGADKDDVMLARCKYQAQLDEYKRFSKVMKLPEQRERIYYDMRGRIAPSQQTYKKYLEGEITPYHENQLKQKSSSAAERWAKSHAGVKQVDYSRVNTDVANRINRSLQRIVREYPQLNGQISEIRFEEINGTAATRISVKNGRPWVQLIFNPNDCMSEKRIQEIIDKEVAEKYWTKKRGLYGVTKHEAGHLLEFLATLKKYGVDEKSDRTSLVIAIMAYQRHEKAEEIVKQAITNCGWNYSSDIMSKRICRYAGEKGPGEGLAEAVSEYQPRKISKEIVKLLMEELK